jgi:hypothetical protein
MAAPAASSIPRDKNRLKSHGFLFSLPAGRTTLKRSRNRLGFNFDIDTENFWNARLDDLATLNASEFFAKHGITADLFRGRRIRMIGKRARPLGWWRTPETISLLLSGLTNKETGKRLGISTSQVHRLRVQAKADAANQPAESQSL